MGLRRRVRVPRSLLEMGDLPRAAGDAGVSVPRLFLVLDDERRRMDLGPRVAPKVGCLPGPRHHAERYVAGRESELEATETRRAVPAQRRDRLVLLCVEDPLHLG